MIRKIKVTECICNKCGHNWIPRDEVIPIQCAKCKSPRWNIEKKQVGQVWKSKEDKEKKK